MLKPAYFFSFFIVFTILVGVVIGEFNKEAEQKRPKPSGKPPRPSIRASKKRQTANRRDNRRTMPESLKNVHLGVSMSSLTGFEKPGMPIRVFDFNGTLPADFNATNHILDLPMKNHLKILVDPEDIDWAHQTTQN